MSSMSSADIFFEPQDRIENANSDLGAVRDHLHSMAQRRMQLDLTASDPEPSKSTLLMSFDGCSLDSHVHYDAVVEVEIDNLQHHHGLPSAVL